MITKILPLFIAAIGLAVGVGSGVFLRPDHKNTAVEASSEAEALPTTEFVKLNNQFVIPIVEEGRVVSMVIMSLSVEVALGGTESVFSREPKLRDAMLQVMFDHANSGGFSGVFTDGANLLLLRKALLEVVNKVMDGVIKDVLISDISRQES